MRNGTSPAPQPPSTMAASPTTPITTAFHRKPNVNVRRLDDGPFGPDTTRGSRFDTSSSLGGALLKAARTSNGAGRGLGASNIIVMACCPAAATAVACEEEKE